MFPNQAGSRYYTPLKSRPTPWEDLPPLLEISYLLWEMAPLLTLHKPWSSQGKSSTRPPSGYPTKMLLNTSSTTPRRFPFKNANLTHEGIIVKLTTASTFLVCDGFDIYLDVITIYRLIKTLDNVAEPAIQALFAFLRGSITRREVNDTGNFIPTSIFMYSTPPVACKWGLNKFNITFPTL